MSNMEEKDILRLSMILENQGATTRDRYICKLVESVIFDSEKNELSIIEICSAIRDRFQLEFDILEIETAIHSKNKGRIVPINNKYQLSAKAINQLSTQVSAVDQLKKYVQLYTKTRDEIDEKILLNLIQKYIYFCFNSNAQNFAAIIGASSKICIDEKMQNHFKPTSEEIDLINDFICWQNADKNKFFYSVISSCYEYCLITANKNPVISKSIFRGKKFFLDTNIIFRIAGLNKDERKFVTKTFVDKCRDVGISLCYTSTVLKEIYRVIDAQIEYIKALTKDQSPVDANLISKISGGYETNDFYVIYYNWCKDSQNKYHDFSSFRNYLTQKISYVISDFEYVDSSNLDVSKKKKEELVEDLMSFKNARRSYRVTTEESVKTDVNQVLHLQSLRPKNASSLWNMNEYIVSADQLLVSWSEKTFDSVPIVVLPSLWLSIILKVSGRATDDDYKSFCMFMTLRHFRTDDDEIRINPIELLSRLSEKTIDSRIKELIITEILTNKSAYTFEVTEDYASSIELAFDKVLSHEKTLHKEELLKAVETQKQEAKMVAEEYKAELANKKTAEEFAQEISMLKAQQKVECFSGRTYIPLIIRGLPFAIVLVVLICWVFNVKPVLDLLMGIATSSNINDKIWSGIVWVFNLFVATLPVYFGQIWDYLSSEKRKDKLCSKYFKQQLKILNGK